MITILLIFLSLSVLTNMLGDMWSFWHGLVEINRFFQLYIIYKSTDIYVLLAIVAAVLDDFVVAVVVFLQCISNIK